MFFYFQINGRVDNCKRKANGTGPSPAGPGRGGELAGDILGGGCAPLCLGSFAGHVGNRSPSRGAGVVLQGPALSSRGQNLLQTMESSGWQ